MTDITSRQNAIAIAAGETPMPVDISSDAEVIKQIEQVIVKNQGMIKSCLSNLPGPMLVMVQGIVKYILLTPLQYLLTLPLTKISGALENFTNMQRPNCCDLALSPAAVNNSDCALN